MNDFPCLVDWLIACLLDLSALPRLVAPLLTAVLTGRRPGVAGPQQHRDLPRRGGDQDDREGQEL